MQLVAVLFLAFVAVECVPDPGFQLGSMSFPVGDHIGGKDGSGMNMQITDKGMDISQRKVKHSTRTGHTESHNVTSSNSTSKEGDAAHLSKHDSEDHKIHDSQEEDTEVQERGFHAFGAGGFEAYDNKKKVSDRTALDHETGKSSSVDKDKNATSGHYAASGNEFDRTSQSKDHHEEYDNRGFTLAKGLNMGPGYSKDVEDGKKGVLKHENGTKDTHEASTNETGSNYSENKDYVKEGDKVKVSGNKQSGNYTKGTAESSASETHLKEQREADENDKEVQSLVKSAKGEDEGKSKENSDDAKDKPDKEKVYVPNAVLQRIYQDKYSKRNPEAKKATVRSSNTNNDYSPALRSATQEYLEALRQRIQDSRKIKPTGDTTDYNTIQAGNTTDTVQARNLDVANASATFTKDTNTHAILGSHLANLKAINSYYNSRNIKNNERVTERTKTDSRKKLVSQEIQRRYDQDITRTINQNKDLNIVSNTRIVKLMSNANGKSFLRDSTYDKDSLTKEIKKVIKLGKDVVEDIKDGILEHNAKKENVVFQGTVKHLLLKEKDVKQNDQSINDKLKTPELNDVNPNQSNEKLKIINTNDNPKQSIDKFNPDIDSNNTTQSIENVDGLKNVVKIQESDEDCCSSYEDYDDFIEEDSSDSLSTDSETKKKAKVLIINDFDDDFGKDDEINDEEL